VRTSKPDRSRTDLAAKKEDDKEDDPVYNWDIVLFTNDKLPPELCQVPPPLPERRTCAVTGLPARYLDPTTGMFYRSAAAYKVLRQRYETRMDRQYSRDLSMLQGQLNEQFKIVGLEPPAVPWL
jgi:hypothetical protein